MSYRRLSLLALAWLLVACGSGAEPVPLAPLPRPTFAPLALNGRRLRVVATTGIIGDIVGQVGGSAIELTTLMAPGQDPHSYEPGPADLATVAAADLLVVNGFDLEESLVRRLGGVAEATAVLPISAGIQPLPAGAALADPGELSGPLAPDPHVWLDPRLIHTWLDNAQASLTELDPANGPLYQANASAYATALDALIAEIDATVAQIPPERRQLVTNHDALAYFAAAYDFTIIGAVIPGASSLAEPSAADLARLARQMEAAGVCAIFVESGGRRDLAEAVAGELESCPAARVVTLPGEAAAASGGYLGMMRANVESIRSAYD
jgi:ABC-type Zn uptake system ZnuABC Zn-binding protein ZnuA